MLICYIGRGITDKDRNILSNQVLILDFLRSAAKMLKTGPIPIMMKPKKKITEDDDNDDMEAPDPEELSSPENATVAVARGTVLITLRNVEPYTLW